MPGLGDDLQKWREGEGGQAEEVGDGEGLDAPGAGEGADFPRGDESDGKEEEGKTVHEVKEAGAEGVAGGEHFENFLGGGRRLGEKFRGVRSGFANGMGIETEEEEAPDIKGAVPGKRGERLNRVG